VKNNLSDQTSLLSNDDIDFKEFFIAIWNGKFIVSLVTAVFIVLSIYIALAIPNKYQSATLLVPNESSAQNSLSSMASGLGGAAAGMLGINISGGGMDKGDYAIALINSKEFFKNLSEIDEILPNIYVSERYDFGSNKIIYEKDSYDSEKGVWVRNPPKGKNVIPTYLEVYPIYTKNLKIKKNNNTGFIEMTYAHVSPFFSQYLLSTIIEEVNTLSRAIDLKRSKDSLTYLEEEVSKTKQKEVSASISKLMESELRIQMLSNIDEHYLIRPIDEPYVPENRFSPNRRVIVIVSTLFGGLLGCLIAIVIHFYRKKPS
tara:strand:+ start:508 stop:1455 length:948 start_codon:yes stop_codon:yes gene_type:complete